MTDIDTAALRAKYGSEYYCGSGASDVLALLDRIDAQAAEIERLRAERDQAQGRLDGQRRAIRRQIEAKRINSAAVARVRVLHDQYLPASVDYDCCAHCNIGGHYVPWPCPTIRAIEGGA